MEKLNKVSTPVVAYNNGGANDFNFLCSLTNATYLKVEQIQANNFGGELPKCIVNFSTTLTILSLHNNKIYGNIPLGIGNLINLEMLEMWNSNLFLLKLENFESYNIWFYLKTISLVTFISLLEI